MAHSIDIINRLTNNLEKTIPKCDPEAIIQFVDTATHIERAFFKHEISDKEREKQYRKLYEYITDFRIRCHIDKLDKLDKLDNYRNQEYNQG